MKLRDLGRVAAGMVFLATSIFAQITTIEGDIKGPDGKPVEKAVVKITRTDIKGNYEVKSNKKGHYIYMGLPIGTYNVSLVIDGKEVDKVNNIHTSPGDNKPVDFDLKNAKKDDAQQQAQIAKAMETGKIPDELARGMTAEQKAAMEKDVKDKSAQMKKRNELNESFNAGMAAKDAAIAEKDPALRAKHWEDAVAAFTKASENDPKQQAVWAQLGESYVKLSETKTGPDFDATIGHALEAYQKAIELKPDDAPSHNNYALALAKAKKFDETQAELKKAADLDPANGGKYYYNLGALLVNANQGDAAGEVFKKAIELQPTYADSYYQYGVTLVGKAKIAADGKVTPVPGTVEAFQKYLELAPTGQYAQSATEMLSTLGSTVDTKFQNPNAKDSKKSTTTKKK